RKDRHAGQAQIAARADQAHRDLAPVGDQNLAHFVRERQSSEFRAACGGPNRIQDGRSDPLNRSLKNARRSGFRPRIQFQDECLAKKQGSQRPASRCLAVMSYIPACPFFMDIRSLIWNRLAALAYAGSHLRPRASSSTSETVMSFQWLR